MYRLAPRAQLLVGRGVRKSSSQGRIQVMGKGLEYEINLTAVLFARIADQPIQYVADGLAEVHGLQVHLTDIQRVWPIICQKSLMPSYFPLVYWLRRDGLIVLVLQVI